MNLKKIIVVVGALSLANSLYAMDNLNEVVKKAKKEGIVDQRVFGEEKVVKEVGIAEEKEVVQGEITPENLEKEEKVARFFNEKKIEEKKIEEEKRKKEEDDRIEKINLEKNKELGKDLSLKSESFIDREAKKYKMRTEVEPVEELKIKNEKKIESLEKKIEKIEKAVTFKIGKGENKYYIFVDISNKKGVSFLKKILKKNIKNTQLNVILITELKNATDRKKKVYILYGENNEDKLNRAKSIFLKNSTKYKWSLMYKNIINSTEGIDDIVNNINNSDLVRKEFSIYEPIIIFDNKLIKRNISEIK